VSAPIAPWWPRSTQRRSRLVISQSCTVPVAAWAEPTGGDELRLHGLVATGDGRVMVRAHLSGTDPLALGRTLGRQLIDEYGGSLIEEWSPVPATS